MLLHVIPRIRGVSTTRWYGYWWASGDGHEGPLVFSFELNNNNLFYQHQNWCRPAPLGQAGTVSGHRPRLTQACLKLSITLTDHIKVSQGEFSVRLETAAGLWVHGVHLPRNGGVTARTVRTSPGD